MALGNHQMHTLTRCVKFSSEQKYVHLYCTPTSNFSFIVLFLKHWAQYTSQFMRIYAVRCSVDNALFQLRYLFGFTLFVFSH